jgi:uncharacterized membrane protein HdeD (DUF308 family)
MVFSVNVSTHDLYGFGKNWMSFFIWGLALFLLGLFAVSASTFTTLVTIILLGILLLISGAVVLVDTLTFWRGKGSGFILHLIMAILYLAAGFILVANPLAGSVSITLFLGIMYICIGIFRIIFSLSLQLLNWGWSLFNGIITLLLGILITASWPASSLFVIGLFVGIDLLFAGWTYMMIALAARNLINRSAST